MTPADGTAALARPRGRPQRLPVDAGLPHTPADPTMRMAWLLATSNILSPASGHLGHDNFVTRMRAQGVVLDASRVSRWQTGALRPRADVLDAYEAVVGLPEGALRAARTALDPAADRSTTGEALSVEAGVALDECLTSLSGPGGTGADWMRLSRSLTSYERVYLEPSTWQRLTTRLIAELSRSSGAAHLRRHAAATELLAHPSAGRHLSRSIGRFLINPDVQTVASVMALLRAVDDDSVGDLVLKLINDDSRVLRRGALSVAPALAARGHHTDDINAALEHHAAHELGRGRATERRIDALDLVTQLSEPALRRVLASVGDPKMQRRVALAHATHELVPTDVARGSADSTAARVEALVGRAGHDPDQMLRKLIREALFHARAERRQLAGLLLACSPYAHAVACTLLRLVARDDTDDLTTAMSWSALRRFGHVLTRDEVAAVALGEKRPALQARAWAALGLAQGEVHDDVAAQLAHTTSQGTTYDQRHSALYALGMTGHSTLQALLTHERPELRRGAAWWLDLGSAIHDDQP